MAPSVEPFFPVGIGIGNGIGIECQPADLWGIETPILVLAYNPAPEET